VLTPGARLSYQFRTSPLHFPPDLYPTLLQIWRATRAGGGRVARASGGGRLSEDELYAVARQVRELSRGFTRERSLAGERYLNDPELLGAYLLHFWPISFAQASLCLSMIARLSGGSGIRSALDLGAGPGAASHALLEAGIPKVSAWDRSKEALSLGREIAEERGFTLETHAWDALREGAMPAGSYDLIVVAHTLNELWPGRQDRDQLRVELLQKVSQALTPSGRLLIIEPALMSTAQEAIKVRDGLARAGFTVELPCIWQGACPALPQGTCHGEFDWEPPREMVRISHAARIGRESLKMAWFVLRRAEASVGARGEAAPPESPDGGLYRVVSEPLLSKSGRIRYLVCGPLGRFALSAPKAAPSPAMKPFYTMKRGDGIRFRGAERRETGWGLGAASTLTVEQHPPRMG
jgi:SAM-dependent methyltransferase